MEIIDIRDEIWVKHEDLIQTQRKMEMDTSEWRIINVELNWLDYILNKIYYAHHELRPKVAIHPCCSAEEGEEWKQ